MLAEETHSLFSKE
jgi:hypothetical protein